MPTWVLLALLSPAIYTVVNFIDKFVLEHKVKDYRGMPIYGAITGFFFATVLWLIFSQPTLGIRDGSLMIASGILTMMGYALYFHVLSKNDASYIIAMLQTTPVFTLLFALAFLNEHLNMNQLLGFVLVLGSVMGLSLTKDTRRFRFNTDLLIILLANVIFALSSIIVKFTENVHGFLPVLIYESWGIALGGLILFGFFGSVRKAFLDSLRTVGKPVLAIMFANEGIFIISKVIQFLAILSGIVSIVSLLGTTQVFYGIAYGVALSLVAPKLFHEDVTFHGVFRKVSYSIVLFVGIYLIR